MKIVALIGERASGKSLALSQIAHATGALVLHNSDTDQAKLHALTAHGLKKPVIPSTRIAVLDEADSNTIQFLQDLDGFDDFIVYVVPATTAAHDLLGIETKAMREEQNSQVPEYVTGYAAMLIQPISCDEVALANSQLETAYGIDDSWDFRFSVSDDGCLLFAKHTYNDTSNEIFSVLPGVEIPRVLTAIQAVTEYVGGHDFNVVPSSVQPIASTREKVGHVSLANFYKLSKGMDI